MSIFNKSWSLTREDMVTVVRGAPGEEGEVLQVLKDVVEAQLGVDIVELGLVRSLSVDDGHVNLVITHPSDAPPAGAILAAKAQEVLEGADYSAEVSVEVEPPWIPSDMSEEGRAQLASHGVRVSE